MKDMQRALRRFKLSNIKKKRKDHWYSGEKTKKQIGILANTPKLCGCWMCSNQRKHFGDSISEIKMKQERFYQ